MTAPSHSATPLPLSGKRFLLTRPEDESNAAFVQSLQALGAEIVQVPLVETKPLPMTLPDLRHFDWIFFTSKNAVRACTDAHACNPMDALQGAALACVGPATEKALQAKGLSAQFVSPVHEAESAARLFAESHNPQGLRILWPCGNLANPKLKRTLEQAGAQVDALTVYETRLRTDISEAECLALSQSFDLLIFTSGSAVTAFQQLNAAHWWRFAEVPVACLGPQTQQTAQAVFARVAIQAAPHTLEGLQQAIRTAFEPH